MGRRLAPPKPGKHYRQLWRVVDGAVLAAFKAHPDFLAPGAFPKTVRSSIVKRVVGAVLGYAEQSAQVRSGEESADDKASDLYPRPDAGVVATPALRLAVVQSAGGGTTPRFLQGAEAQQ